MSTSPDDLGQHSPLDFDPHVGLHRPSPHSSPPDAPHSETSSPRPHEESDEEKAWKEDLCHAICCNKWSDVKAIMDQHPNALTVGISFYQRTALHVAAQFGHVTIVEELLKLLPRDSLLNGDSNRETALSLACWFCGITRVAKYLVNKNIEITMIPDIDDSLPVIRAFENGNQEMGRYLYSVTPLERLTDRQGSNLLCLCIQTQCFDIALKMLQQREELLLMPIDDGGSTPIHQVSTLNNTILSPSELIFWKRWIYNNIHIPPSMAMNNACVDIHQEERSQEDKAKLTELGHRSLLRLITSIKNFVGVKKMRELKLLHAQAEELLRLVCRNGGKAYQKGVMEEALCLAAKEGNVEFVFRVTKAIPEIFLSSTMDHCFDEAIVYRQAKVFNLIHGLRFKQSLTGFLKDEVGSLPTLMQKVAIKAPDHVLNRIYAPTLQMQRELQWFKEIESLTPPSIRVKRNKDDMTAEEVFRESHNQLMKQGEEWIKSTASSCSVVGALITTIMFAAAFTVPGGNDQTLGYPLLIKQSFFNVFIFSTISSLLSSSTSVLMFLAILTSQYSEEKFLKSLPTKLILGLSFLFISIVSMIIAFISTIRIMFEPTNYSWSLLPIFILASVPIFLFVLSQFPLLLHTYVSTYGKIFDRKVEPWP